MGHAKISLERSLTMSRVRTRFAPSPTGTPHIGNIRTALFEWLFARHNGGDFIVRIEDTDQSRKVEGSVESLLESLRWLGMDWDEGPEVGGDNGPYFQSERLEYYRTYTDKLIEMGKAYRFEDERGSAVKFAMPSDGSTTTHDRIRGEVSFDNLLLDDFVILKSDGFPTYHLAHIVDDHLMGITHVIRAEEWLPSLPKHLLIYAALEWDPPEFAHLPVILAPDKSKLSKRHGSTSLLEYKESGYLPQAMMNFMALLGWSLDDKSELFSRDELVNVFSLDRVVSSSAIFNIEKLDWMNGHYIREMSSDELTIALLSHWNVVSPPGLPSGPDPKLLAQIVPLVQDRLKTLNDAAERIPFFFSDEFEYEASELIQRNMDDAETVSALEASMSAIGSVHPFTASGLEERLRTLAEDLELKVGQLLGTLRVATSGLKVSPPLFESLEILGRERVLHDLRRAIEKLSQCRSHL